jgi:hypothetical protein
VLVERPPANVVNANADIAIVVIIFFIVIINWFNFSISVLDLLHKSIVFVHLKTNKSLFLTIKMFKMKN